MKQKDDGEELCPCLGPQLKKKKKYLEWDERNTALYTKDGSKLAIRNNEIESK